MGKSLGVGNKSSQEDIIPLNIKNCFFLFPALCTTGMWVKTLPLDSLADRVL